MEEDTSYKPRIIHAHENEIAAMALSPTGNLLATASKRVYYYLNERKKNCLYLLFLGYTYTYILNNRIM